MLVILDSYLSILQVLLEEIMEKLAYLCFLPIILVGCQATQINSEQSVKGMDLKQPEPQVLCDQYVCTNSSGISKELTQKYLGQVQADKVFSQGQFDHTQFTFANGIFCDTQVQKCYVDRYSNGDGKRSAIAENYTKALFYQ